MSSAHGSSTRQSLGSLASERDLILLQSQLDQLQSAHTAPADSKVLPVFMRAHPIDTEPLSRERILQLRRLRLAAATIPAFTAGGYNATTIDDLVRTADIATGSLYELFTGKEECFLLACELIIAEYRHKIETTVDTRASWREQLRSALEVLLAAIAADPGRARLALIETQAAGSRALEIYWEALDAAAAALRHGRRSDPNAETLPKSFDSAITAGLAWILRLHLATDEDADINSLLPELEDFAAAEFLAAGQPEGKEGTRGVDAALTTGTHLNGARGDREETFGLARLPPGKRGLPREFVLANQRTRLTAGTIAAVAASGCEDATISEIVAATALSRRTFYAHFPSKQRCILDTYRLVADHLEANMRAAGTEHEDWGDRVRAQLAALFGAFEANPDLVRFLLIAAPGGDREIAACHRDFLASVLEILTDSRTRGSRGMSLAYEQGLAGGLAALIAHAVSVGEEYRLPDLATQIFQLLSAANIGETLQSAASSEQR